MHLDPGMQDLSQLASGQDAYHIGVSDNGVLDSNADFGARAVEAIVEAVHAKVKALLGAYDAHQGHGCPQ